MTSTATTPARANSVGDLCPSWCTTGHGPDVTDIHRARDAEISLDGPGHFGYLCAYSVRLSADDVPRVALHARSRVMPAGTTVQAAQFLRAGHALELAGVIDVLAHATPEEHRELAAAIRQAAAVITEASGA